jgi:hypothetical protein
MAAGNACRNGVTCGTHGSRGLRRIQYHRGEKRLLRHAVGAGHYDAERMAESLGKPFYIESPGIGLKKYPSCYHTHRALDGVFQLLGSTASTTKTSPKSTWAPGARHACARFHRAGNTLSSQVQHALLHRCRGGRPPGDARHFHRSQVRRSPYRREPRRRFTFLSPTCRSGLALRTSARIPSSSGIR